MAERLRWVTPPNRSRGRDRDHADVARKLKARPGQWAVVDVRASGNAASTAAYQIRNGTLAAYRPPGAFDAVSRKVEGEHAVFARYLGEETGDVGHTPTATEGA